MIYIVSLNAVYIGAQMLMLNSFNVLRDPVPGDDKLQMLALASSVNFLVYYLFGALLLVLGINEVNLEFDFRTSYF